MDSAGWSAVADVLRVLGMTREALDRAVAENDKGRLQLDLDRIRACQGHSIEGVPVLVDALEASWVAVDIDTLWHGTSLTALGGIARTGIDAGARTHVHLAEAPNSKVGKRANADVLLQVSVSRLNAEGVKVFRAPNGVLLARYVPRDAIIDAMPLRASTSDTRDACIAVGLPCSA